MTRVIPARVFYNHDGETFKLIYVTMVYDKVPGEGYAANVLVLADTLPDKPDDLNEDLFIAAEESLGDGSVRDFEYTIAAKI